MDLGFHDIKRPGQLLGGIDRFVDGHRGIAGGHGHAEFREQFLGLVFVDVHEGPSLGVFEEREWGGLKHSGNDESTPARLDLAVVL